MTEFGLDCFVYRAKNRLTQKEMGQLCGVDRALIIDIEKRPPCLQNDRNKGSACIGGGQEMSAMHEALREIGIFAFWMIFVPVLVFTAGIIRDYFRKERCEKNVGKNSGRNQKR